MRAVGFWRRWVSLACSVALALPTMWVTPVVAGAAGPAPFAWDDSGWAVATQKVYAADGGVNDDFGIRVAVDGDTAVVGARRHDLSGTNDEGAAYVFVKSGGAWVQQAKLEAPVPQAGADFGQSVDISGDSIVVGVVASAGAGAAHVYTRSGAVWSHEATLTASDAAAGDGLGTDVAIEGNTVVCGAPTDDTPDNASGSAYVFTRSGTTWTQQQKLLAADGAADDIFGSSVALSGDTAVVGAYRDDNPELNSGSAYVFIRSGTTWTQQQKLLAADGAAGDHFGIDVSVAGDTAVIGAPNVFSDGNADGAAYVFVRSGATWTQQQQLLDLNSSYLDEYGLAVAVSGNRVAVGSKSANDLGLNSGAVELWTASGGTWSREARITAPDGFAGDLFGSSVGLSGTTLISGASQSDNSGHGAAYLSVLPPLGAYATDEDVALNMPASGVLANDWDPFGESITATLLAGPAHGSLTLNDDGSFSYTPDADWSGTDTFRYRAYDGTSYSNPATATIVVAPINDAPVATDDTTTTAEDTALAMPKAGLLGNDTDVDGPALSISAFTQPTHGSVASVGSDLVYTPAANYNGPDSFTYTVTDGSLSDTATVSITVTPVDDPPAPPTNVKFKLSGTKTAITWTKSPDATGYKVYVNGKLVATLGAGSSSFLYPGRLGPSAKVEVQAVGAGGLTSARAPGAYVAPAYTKIGLVRFMPYSAVLTSHDRLVLRQLAGLIASQGYKTVRIEGHTSRVLLDGGAAYRQRLSLARAKAAKKYLAAQLAKRGASATILTYGYGATRPVASNKTAHGRYLNRRAEIFLR